MVFAPEPVGADTLSGALPAGAQSYRREIILPSPWLSGIPADGVWDQQRLAALSYEVAHGLAQNALRSAGRPSLDPLQRALADEYAAWVSHGRDAAQAPLLGRVIEQRGREALPMVFLSLKGSRLPALFVVQWLSFYPSKDAVAYFQLLLAVEQCVRLDQVDGRRQRVVAQRLTP